MKLDDDKEAVNIINNAVGSLNNKARAIFNRGYMCGYEDGKREAVQMLERTLMDMTAEQTEPSSSEKPNNCDEQQYEMGMGTLKCDNCSEYGSFKCAKCDGEMYFKRLEPKDEPTISKMEQVEDEPQTDCAWK